MTRSFVSRQGLDEGNSLDRFSAHRNHQLRCVLSLAMISVLLGCGLRRAELASLRKEDVQLRQGHGAIMDLVGKGSHIRTVPMPAWVKDAVDRWMTAAEVANGRVFRAVSRHGTSWEEMESPRTSSCMWSGTVLEEQTLLPLRPTICVEPSRSCVTSTEVNWSRFSSLLGHASILTTERYLGCKQNLEEPVNDRFGCLFSKNLGER
jgi:integrase